MVKCVCGKPIDKMPAWLEEVSVEFVCNSCPNRTVKQMPVPKAEVRKVEEDNLPESDEDDEDDF